MSSTEKSAANDAALKIKLTSNYLKEYLFPESLIPSEGGWQASLYAKKLIQDDVMRAIKLLPRDSPLNRKPIEILLDFFPRTEKSLSEVIAWARLSEPRDIKAMGGTDLKLKIYREARPLRFPSLQDYGRQSKKDLLVAVQEFGHAYGAMLFGNRFKIAVARSPSPGIGGYVRFEDNVLPTAKALLADLLSTLGSRAMERLFLDENPLDPNSAISLTSGSSSDVAAITEKLWGMIYKLGMVPGGGIVERGGLGGPNEEMHDHRRYWFAELPNDRIEQLGLIVRDLEEYLVRSYLDSHSVEEFRPWIEEFSRQGQMSEAEIYRLVGYPYPGDRKEFAGETSKLLQRFPGQTEVERQEVTIARNSKRGHQQKTSVDMLTEATKVFLESVTIRMGSHCAAKFNSSEATTKVAGAP